MYKSLYFIICLFIRLLLVFLVLNINKSYLQYLGIIFIIIGIGFLNLYFFNKRLNAIEGGGITWWHKYRLLHGMLYLTAGIYSIKGYKLSFIPLLIDVLFGFIIWYDKRHVKLF